MVARHRAWAEIDLSALANNIRVVRSALLAPRTRILAVIKANAYGHGALPVAARALAAGCWGLGVGDSGEALELREHGITAPVVILGAILEEEIPRVVEEDVDVTVHSGDLLPLLEAEARRQHRVLRVHLKVDTGMGRLGCPPDAALDLARAILDCPHLELEGLATHLSSVAGADPSYTTLQLARFRQTLDALGADGIRPRIVHAANSAGIFTFPNAHFDLVRPGISLYGMDPGLFARLKLPLQPVMSLKARVAFVKPVPAGATIGYDQSWTAPRDTRIATVTLGYSDGYPHRLTNRGQALVRGRRCPVVGKVMMDYLLVDVGALSEAAVGDEVTLIGRDGLEEVRIEELAREAGTLPYEIACGIGRRVKRVYVERRDADSEPPTRPMTRRMVI
jgi:alanine racemase